uniref:Uncharacterized protein n=1 Tax=Anopheles farauti TaxID=69004 RepID=A0A182Q5Y1_9DIPT
MMHLEVFQQHGQSDAGLHHAETQPDTYPRSLAERKIGTRITFSHSFRREPVRIVIALDDVSKPAVKKMNAWAAISSSDSRPTISCEPSSEPVFFSLISRSRKSFRCVPCRSRCSIVSRITLRKNVATSSCSSFSPSLFASPRNVFMMNTFSG